MSALLSAVELTKDFGETVALRNVSVDVEEGTTGLLGANGAGKSTLMTIFLGLLRPTSGKITVLGEDGDKSTQAHRLLPGIRMPSAQRLGG